ncbi:hypothetical protein FHX49_000487 [Microbacterium endophyticum]|uniref:Uncharacterized protein n=1 Tax=Microbacterium endophyticum TaxID=1526412 RepID=A0A7W4V167_9MICO|nr:hypothetical protein [Microbacterium endophyticum]MBB2974946.1 hypothetical protein [Microbacterium endophyticum]NIK37243.1 hypothetical protein [Microbacterium endophyticum]
MSQSARIYRPDLPEDDFEWALPVDPDDFETIQTLPQRTVGSVWRPIRMALIKEDEGAPVMRRADMPWLGRHVLVLRDEAIEVVGPLLRPHGELLPLVCDYARLMLFSAPLIAGVLDEERSKTVRFRAGGIMSLTEPVFRVEALGSSQVFKLAEMPRGSLYLRAELVEAILATGMTSGTNFKAVFEG